MARARSRSYLARPISSHAVMIRTISADVNGTTSFASSKRGRIETAAQYRQRILLARDDTPYSQLQQELRAADDALSLPREVGNAVIAVFFENANAAERESARRAMRVRVEAILKGSVTEEMPQPPIGIPPFHW